MTQINVNNPDAVAKGYVDFFIELESADWPKDIRSAGIPEELKGINWGYEPRIALPKGKVFQYCRVPKADFEKIQRHPFFEDKIVGKSWVELWERPYEFRDHIFFVSDARRTEGTTTESQIEYRHIPISSAKHTDLIQDDMARPFGVIAGDDVPGFSVLPVLLPDLDETIKTIEASAQLRFGDPYELAHRKVVVERITALQNELKGLRLAHGGIGHNNPPPDSGVLVEKYSEIAEAANNLETEISKPEPDALAVGRSVQMLHGVLKWAAAKADLTFDEFLKTLARVGALGAVVGLTGKWAEVLQLIQSVVSASAKWLSSITLPF